MEITPDETYPLYFTFTLSKEDPDKRYDLIVNADGTVDCSDLNEFVTAAERLEGTPNAMLAVGRLAQRAAGRG